MADNVLAATRWIVPPFYDVEPMRSPRDASHMKTGRSASGFGLTSSAKFGTGEMTEDVPRSPRADARKSRNPETRDLRPPLTAQRYTLGVDGEGSDSYGVGGV